MLSRVANSRRECETTKGRCIESARVPAAGRVRVERRTGGGGGGEGYGV